MTIAKDDDEWGVAPLSAQDEKLVNAYRRQGVAVDELAYTEEFLKLCGDLGVRTDDLPTMHDTYKRLLSLRKQGRLPRLFSVTSA